MIRSSAAARALAARGGALLGNETFSTYSQTLNGSEKSFARRREMTCENSD